MPAATRILCHIGRQRRQPTGTARAQESQAEIPQHLSAIPMITTPCHMEPLSSPSLVERKLSAVQQGPKNVAQCLLSLSRVGTLAERRQACGRFVAIRPPGQSRNKERLDAVPVLHERRVERSQ